MYKIIISSFLILQSFQILAQNSRAKNLYYADDTEFLNFTGEVNSGLDEIHIFNTNILGEFNTGDIIISKYTSSGNHLNTYSIYHKDLDFKVLGSSKSINSGNNILVGNLKLNSVSSNPHYSFFLEIEEATNSIVNFKMYNSASDTYDFTFVDVEIGYNEYIIVGYLQNQGIASGSVSFIAGLDISSGSISWHKQYITNGNAIRNGFDNVLKFECEAIGFRGDDDVPSQGSCYLISGVGNDSGGDFMSFVGVFDAVSKSFNWTKQIKLYMGESERATQVLPDGNGNLMLFSQNEYLHNSLVHVFDINGNYQDSYTYIPAGNFYPYMVLTSVVKDDENNFIMNGYYINGSPIIGSHYTIKLNNQLDVNDALFIPTSDIYFTLNGPNEFALGYYFSGPSIWTSQSQFLIENDILYPFGERSSTGNETVNFVKISDWSDRENICAEPLDMVQYLMTNSLTSITSSITEIPLYTLQETTFSNLSIKNLVSAKTSCISGNKIFKDDLLTEKELEIDFLRVYNLLGQELFMIKDYSELNTKFVSDKILIIKEIYTDGSIKSNKVYNFK